MVLSILYFKELSAQNYYKIIYFCLYRLFLSQQTVQTLMKCQLNDKDGAQQICLFGFKYNYKFIGKYKHSNNAYGQFKVNTISSTAGIQSDLDPNCLSLVLKI